MKDYHLFWNGVFSQFYTSEFKYAGITFNCAEQFMMRHKAIFFEDYEIADKILKETHPGVQKGLGRQVKGFDIDTWSKVARGIVYIGSECKYTQNPELCKKLIETYPATLVEASPHDKVWGDRIGRERS